MTEMSAGIYGCGGEATTPIYSGGNTCTVVFSVESNLAPPEFEDDLYGESAVLTLRVSQNKRVEKQKCMDENIPPHTLLFFSNHLR